MERALANFMLDLHTTESGYTEVVPPALVRAGTLYGTGQLPKFGEDLYRTTDDYGLIPTAEVQLTGLVAGRVVEAPDPPLRVTAWTNRFRSKAGVAGHAPRAMLRRHHFTRVEADTDAKA